MENLEQKIVEVIHVLPDEKKAEVLEFAENLRENATNGAKSAEEKEKTDEEARRKKLMRFVGIAKSKKGDVSERVDEILAEGINKKQGWSLP